jgi:hypothetical protein
MIRKFALLFLIGAAMAGCSSHTLDCGLGVTHANCRPGTAGYQDPNKFAAVDDRQCRSFGMLPGTKQYTDCRLDLSKQHNGASPTSPAP